MNFFAISTVDFQNNIQIISFGLTRSEGKEEHNFILQSLFDIADKNIQICKLIIIDES
jgi:hypothetical protein